MSKGRGKRTSNVIPLNDSETLFETSSRDVWQSTLITADGVEVGPVIRQVIEPKMYTIRYLVVYDVRLDRHLLHPSNAIQDITEQGVLSSLRWHEISLMPPFHQCVTRSYEQALYKSLGRTPYWQEERCFDPKQDDT